MMNWASDAVPHIPDPFIPFTPPRGDTNLTENAPSRYNDPFQPQRDPAMPMPKAHLFDKKRPHLSEYGGGNKRKMPVKVEVPEEDDCYLVWNKTDKKKLRSERCVDTGEMTLDTYNCDINLLISNDGMSCTNVCKPGLMVLAAGGKANYGVNDGLVVYQIKLMKDIRSKQVMNRRGSETTVRIGWSTDYATLQLGADAQSFGLDNYGNYIHDNKHVPFHRRVDVGDVVTCYLDMTGRDTFTLGFSVNEEQNIMFLPPIPNSKIRHRSLFPHVYVKNLEVAFNFGQMRSSSWVPLRDSSYTFISDIVVSRRERGTLPPPKGEVLMMVGLPGSGKTHWAKQYQEANPEKKYYLINAAEHKQQVAAAQNRKDNKTVFENECLHLMNDLLKMAGFSVRNYIIELDNEDMLTQYRKLYHFNHPKRGIQYTKKAVLVMPSDAEYRRRLRQRAQDGKPVADELLRKMKGLFRLPSGRKVTTLNPGLNQAERVNRLDNVPPQIFEEVELFEEVIYTELDGQNAHSLAYQYIEEGRRGVGVPPIPPIKPKQEKKALPANIDNWVNSDDLMLDRYNSDLNMQISPDGLSCAPLTQQGFRYMWAGVRANYGVSNGKVAFQIKVLREAQMDKTQPDMQDSYVGRVGWSTDDAHLQLGEQPKSFGYGGTGKWSVNGRFQDFLTKYSIGDVVTCYLDMSERARVIISYAVNDGPIKAAPSAIQRYQFDNQPLFPHICSKNLEISVYFGSPGDYPYFPLRDESYSWIATVPPGQRVRGLKPPPMSEREVLFMIGLPGAGKTHWALQEQKNKPEKRYNLLGLNLIIDKMKIIGLARKGNYKGRWEILLDKANYCLNYLVETAHKTNRNYILDQTNVYAGARRKKQKYFKDFRKVAVLVLPTEEDFKVRFRKMTMKEGEKVPEAILNQMKSNFALPDGAEIKIQHRELNEKFAEEHRQELDGFSRIKTWKGDPNLRFDELIYTELALENARFLVHKYKQEGLAASSNAPKENRKLDDQTRKANAKSFFEAAEKAVIPHRPTPSRGQSADNSIYQSVPDFYKYEDRSDEQQDIQLSSAINQIYSWSHAPNNNRGNQAPFTIGGNFNHGPNTSGGNFNQTPNAGGGNVNQTPNTGGGNFNQTPSTGGSNFNRTPNTGGNNFSQTPNTSGNKWNQAPNTGGDNFNQVPNAAESSWKRAPGGGDFWSTPNVKANSLSGGQRNSFSSPSTPGGDNLNRDGIKGSGNFWDNERKDSGYGKSVSSYEQTPQNSWQRPPRDNHPIPSDNLQRAQEYGKRDQPSIPGFGQIQERREQPQYGRDTYGSSGIQQISSARNNEHSSRETQPFDQRHNQTREQSYNNDRQRSGFHQPSVHGYSKTREETRSSNERDLQPLKETFMSPGPSFTQPSAQKWEQSYSGRPPCPAGGNAPVINQPPLSNQPTRGSYGASTTERQSGGSYGHNSANDQRQNYNPGQSASVYGQAHQTAPQSSNNPWSQDRNQSSSYGGQGTSSQYGYKSEPPKVTETYPNNSAQTYNQPRQAIGADPWSHQPTQNYNNYGSQNSQPFQQAAGPASPSYGSQTGQTYQQNPAPNSGHGQSYQNNSGQAASYPGYGNTQYGGNTQPYSNQQGSRQSRSQQRW